MTAVLLNIKLNINKAKSLLSTYFVIVNLYHYVCYVGCRTSVCCRQVWCKKKMFEMGLWKVFNIVYILNKVFKG